VTRGRASKEQDDGAEGPLRRCIVSGETLAPEMMVRFVVGPDGVIVPDVAHKLPGRGCWVTATRAAIAKACEKGAFSKSAKAAVKCPPDLVAQVERLLVKRCVEHLGLARRAGLAIVGYAQVEEMFRRRDGRIAALIEAADSGPADRGKLMKYARVQGDVPVIGCLDSGEIGLAFGRENVVHAALASGALSARFLVEAGRLGGFRVLCPPEWGAA
jgi:hypothetical protein